MGILITLLLDSMASEWGDVIMYSKWTILFSFFLYVVYQNYMIQLECIGKIKPFYES